MNYLQVFLAFFLLLIPNFYSNSFAASTDKKAELASLKEKETIDNENLQRSDYLLGPGDQLRLKLQDELEGFNGIYKVLNDGSIILPIVGQVYVEFLSIQQAGELIEKKLSKELLFPQIILTIAQTRPMKISVIGEVNNPGIYSNYEGNVPIETLVDAIRAAGGITPNSNLTKISITRRIGGLEEKYKITKLDLFDLIYNGNQSQNPYLLDKDTIRVERADNLPTDIAMISSSSLSPRNISITIIGAVEFPGVKKLKANTPLLQAILSAGGLKSPEANRHRIELIRINRNGTVSRMRFKYDLSEGISEEKNPPLMNGDLVKIYPTNLARLGKGIKGVTDPVTGIVNAITLFKIIEGY